MFNDLFYLCVEDRINLVGLLKVSLLYLWTIQKYLTWNGKMLSLCVNSYLESLFLLKYKYHARKCRIRKERRGCVCMHAWGCWGFFRDYRELPGMKKKAEKSVFPLEYADKRAVFFNVCRGCHRKKKHKRIWNCFFTLNDSFVIHYFILYLHILHFMFAVSLLILKTIEKNNLHCQYLCALCVDGFCKYIRLVCHLLLNLFLIPSRSSLTLTSTLALWV